MIKILGQIRDGGLPDIETERLYLRLRLVSDTEDIFAYTNSPGVTWPAGFLPTKNIEAEAYYLENIMLECWAEQKIPSGYDICLKGTNKTIGPVNLSKYHANDVLEMSYLLHLDYWRQELVPEVAHVLLEVGFTLLNPHKAEIGCYGYNKASQRTAEKLGFTLEARIRDRKDA